MSSHNKKKYTIFFIILFAVFILYIGYLDIKTSFEPICTFLLFLLSPFINFLIKKIDFIYFKIFNKKFIYFLWFFLTLNIIAGYLLDKKINTIVEGVISDIYIFKEKNNQFPNSLEELYHPKKVVFFKIYDIKIGFKYIYTKEKNGFTFYYSNYFLKGKKWDMKKQILIDVYD